jgi:hypothetical protein
VVTTNKWAAAAYTYVDSHLTQTEASALYQSTNAALTALSANPSLYQATNAALTALAGNPSLYQATNANLTALAANPQIYQATNAALTALASNPSLYQATNANLTALAANPQLYQATNATLTSLGALGNGMVAKTGAGTLAARTITAGTGITLSNGDGVSGNPTVTLAIPDASITTNKIDATFHGLLTAGGGLISSVTTDFEVDGGELALTNSIGTGPMVRSSAILKPIPSELIPYVLEDDYEAYYGYSSRVMSSFTAANSGVAQLAARGVKLTLATTANSLAIIHNSTDATYVNFSTIYDFAYTNRFYFSATIGLGEIWNPTDDYEVFVGFASPNTSFSTPHGRSAGFRGQRSSANWLAVSSQSSTESSVDTGVAPVANKYTTQDLGVLWSPNTSSAVYYINNVPVATNTVNVAPNDNSMGLMVAAKKLAGTGAIRVHLFRSYIALLEP